MAASAVHGHKAGFKIAALAAVFFRRCRVDQQPGGFDLRRHVGELDLNGLMLRDRFAKGVTLLRVLDRFFKRRPRDAETTRRDIEPLRLKTRHHLLESETFNTTDKIGRGNWKVIEVRSTVSTVL